MTALYERPTDSDPGDLPLLRRLAEITAERSSVLSDDITDLADLVRAGLPVDAERGRTALDVYEQSALVLGRRLKDYLSAGGTARIPVAFPSLDDVLTILGTEDGDEFARVEFGIWLLWLEMWLRSWGAEPASHDPKAPTAPAIIENGASHDALHHLAEAAAEETSAHNLGEE